MNAYKMTLLAVYALGLIITVARVGKEREPLTSADAVVSLFVTAGLVTLVVLS